MLGLNVPWVCPSTNIKNFHFVWFFPSTTTFHINSFNLQACTTTSIIWCFSSRMLKLPRPYYWDSTEQNDFQGILSILPLNNKTSLEMPRHLQGDLWTRCIASRFSILVLQLLLQAPSFVRYTHCPRLFASACGTVGRISNDVSDQYDGMIIIFLTC